MSKGSKRRPGQQFSENFDKIKWGSVKWTPKEKERPVKTHHIMTDIEPYKATAGDVALDGEAPIITSRSRHKEFLRRNNYEEVGTERDYFFKYDGKSHDNPTRNW